MRVSPFLSCLLLLPLFVVAQGDQEPTPAADAPPSPDAGGQGGGAGNENVHENTLDPTRPWNVSYFTYPTRNNYCESGRCNLTSAMLLCFGARCTRCYGASDLSTRLDRVHPPLV